MSTFLRSAIAILALFASASATMAQTIQTPDTTPQVYGNSADGVRHFWDQMQRNGN
jgi:hypothetical protein